jgi:hypothetical protein
MRTVELQENGSAKGGMGQGSGAETVRDTVSDFSPRSKQRGNSGKTGWRVWKKGILRGGFL